MFVIKPDTSDHVEATTAPDIAANDLSLAARTKAVLQRHYPGWAWRVQIPIGQGVIIVRNLDCDWKGKFGFVLHKDKVSRDLELKVMRAGGELLERYKMIRAAYDPRNLEGRKMVFEKAET